MRNTVQKRILGIPIYVYLWEIYHICYERYIMYDMKMSNLIRLGLQPTFMIFTAGSPLYNLKGSETKERIIIVN